MILPPNDIPASEYFGEHYTHQPNHYKLHQYWFESMRGKGAIIDEKAPAYDSPFFEESMDHPRMPDGALWRVDDDALENYFDELKKAIDESDPSPRGQKKFKKFMRKFFRSLPRDIVYELQPITGEYEGVIW